MFMLTLFHKVMEVIYNINKINIYIINIITDKEDKAPP